MARWAIAAAAVAVAVLAAVLAPRGLGQKPEPIAAPATPPRLTVRLTTSPPGARAVFVPLDDGTAEPRPERAVRPAHVTPVTVPDLPAGEYLVVVVLPGHGFHEVYRTVDPDPDAPAAYPSRAYGTPGADGVYELRPVTIPRGDVTNGMVAFAAGRFIAGTKKLSGVPPHEREVAPFFLGATEISARDYLRVTGRIARQSRQFEPQADRPAVRVSFDDALDYAERVGCRLPDEFEYEFAATAGGTRAYPWGDEPAAGPWRVGRIGEPAEDRTATQPPAIGLYSNALEWTVSGFTAYPGSPAGVVLDARSDWMRRRLHDMRVIRGGPRWLLDSQSGDAAIDEGPRARAIWPRNRFGFGLGFRCARSAAPRFQTP